MKSTVRILLLEDETNEVELIVNELGKSGVDFRLHHVKDREGFVRALQESPPDLILSDYRMPQFDGMEALRLAKEAMPGVPFIILTGSMNEETAVQCMKMGATDYLLKNNLGRLGSAVRGAMEAHERWVVKEKADLAVGLLAAIVESSNEAIISKNLDSTIMSWNRGAERIFGYSAAEAIGRSMTLLIPREAWNQEALIMDRIKRGESVEHLETTRITKQGRRLVVSVTVSPVKDSTGKIIGASNIAWDMTERKRAEEQLRASLEEKELLLKEVHHRVKNNLQVVSSLLNLQSGTIKNPELLALFKENQGRVHSMALVHEQLYKSKSLSQIDFASYLKQLAPHLFHSFAVSPAFINLKLDVAKVMLSLDVAIPCALIVNELVSNSLKYAFPGNRSGEIQIILRAGPNESAVLTVRDNGVGLPKTLDYRNSESLGLQLVNTLTAQLQGELEVHNHVGAEFTIRFSNLKS